MPSLQDMYNEPKPMTAHEKAAILFIALGGDHAAKVFEHMDEDEIESITLEIANNKHVSVEKKATVISEFYSLMMANDYLSTGGLEALSGDFRQLADVESECSGFLAVVVGDIEG